MRALVTATPLELLRPGHGRPGSRPRVALATTRPRARAPDLGAGPAPSVPSLAARLFGGGGSAAAVSRALTALLSTPTVPIGSYVATPAGVLHGLDPRVKQAWLLALLLLPGKLALPGKGAMCAAVAALTMASLPRGVWGQQLRTLALLCALLFLFTALGADSVPPLSQARLPGVGVDASLPAAAGHARSSGYSYVLLHLGPLHVTRRGAAFAASAACITFTLLQSARLVLCTTRPEALAAGLAWAASPLGRLVTSWAAPLDDAVLALLLALRFCALVFEEARNLALAAATRGVNWDALGGTGALEVALALGARLTGALFAHAAHIADAMRARGFTTAAQARAALQYGTPLQMRPATDGVACALLLALVLLVGVAGVGAR